MNLESLGRKLYSTYSKTSYIAKPIDGSMVALQCALALIGAKSGT